MSRTTCWAMCWAVALWCRLSAIQGQPDVGETVPMALAGALTIAGRLATTSATTATRDVRARQGVRVEGR